MALGEVASGYDIGCKFGKMVNEHPVLGGLACEHHYHSLVGAFHGHGHCRLCQLTHLATYVHGVGLEPLEECETFFSKSNALASSTCYATRFHRKQAIATYLQHTDVFDTYQSLSTLLTKKYKTALEVKSTAPALEKVMRDLGIESKATFITWLTREKGCLLALTREPVEETLAMEYVMRLVSRLVNLATQTERMQHVLGIVIPPPAQQAIDNYDADAKATRRLEAQRRHAMELHNKVLLAVQDLEVRLDTVRWLPNSDEWQEAAILVGKRRYQRALDQLQGLIIARMFELTKINMSGTGYKLRKHIAKALQAHSRAVRTALQKYNVSAAAMRPARPSLTWEQFMEYAFLSDFNLLRDGREDIRQELWAKPVGRVAMDMYFKIERADKEIFRLNIEIPRFLTYMHDEEDFLQREVERVRQLHGDGLAHQVERYQMREGRFNDEHHFRLLKLVKLPVCTASMRLGVAINKDRLQGAVDSVLPTTPPTSLTPPPDSDSDSEDEVDVLAAQYALFTMTEDMVGGRAAEEVMADGAPEQ
ncbi:hypothetical protein C8R44DRAFT_891295 [Mycena epipterygia]|nr:hypothetical protein C8R44DRAFT_891295 [Mycena epipterygia]